MSESQPWVFFANPLRSLRLKALPQNTRPIADLAAHARAFTLEV